MNPFTPKKLSILLFLFASFLQSGFYWLLTILISRKYGIEVLGKFSYALAILTPLTVLGGLQLKSYFLTRKDKDLAGKIKWLRLSFLSSLLLVSSITISFLEPWLFPAFVILALLKWGELWSELSHALWQFEEGLKSVNRSLIIRYLLLFLTLFLLWKIEPDLEKDLILLAGVSIVVAFGDYFLSSLHKVSISRKGSKSVFFTTLSLSASSLLTALLVNIPRYQLKELRSLEELGMFSILFYYYVIPSMVVNYSCQGLLKEFNEMKKSPGIIFKVLGSLTLFSLVYFFLLFFAGETLTLKIYGKAPFWNLTIVVLITLAFYFGSMSSILHYTLMSSGIYKIQFRTNLLSSSITLITGFLLIGTYGITGAFLAFVAGLLIQSIIYIYEFSRSKV